MGNFGRVFALVFRHPWVLCGVTLTAVLVGVLWGGNISAVYPIVEVSFRGESLHYWVDMKIEETRQDIVRLEDALKSLRRDAAAGGGKATAEARLQSLEAELQNAKLLLARYESWQPWIRRWTPDDPFQTLLLVILALLVGTVLKSAALVLNIVLVGYLAQSVVYDLRTRFFRNALELDVNTFSNEGVADLMSRFTHDIQCVYGGVVILSGKLVREPLKMAACLIGAAIISWPLLLVSLLVVPPAAWAVRQLGRSLKRANRRAMEEMSLLYGTLEEAFRSIRAVKAFTMEPHERRRFREISRRYLRRGLKIAWYDALTNPLTEVLGIGIISLAMMAGAYLVLREQTTLFGIPMASQPISMPSLVLFYAFLAGAADPIRKLSDVFSGLQSAAAAADRIYAVIDRQPKVKDAAHAVAVPRHHRHIVFDGVGFAYTPDRPVLRDINLEIPFGQTLVILGPSGCGKSTLASLIPRFADPTEGEIRLDGVPLPNIRLRSLRRQIGVVTQEPLLFNDTVLNNIRYGSPSANEEQAVAAAVAANAHRFITEELPHEYQTVIGPMGNLLSGGQRQRIALARAILRDPAILILDEATSQIDLESEQLIQRALEQFVQGRTVIIITHRLAAVQMADRVMLLQDGRIVSEGTHGELLPRCEAYRRLVALQFDELRESA